MGDFTGMVLSNFRKFKVSYNFIIFYTIAYFYNQFFTHTSPFKQINNFTNNQ